MSVGRSCRIASALLLLSAQAASPQSEAPSIALVSAASYESDVAPASFASLFGANLTETTAVAELDALGQLPTELAGVTVEVGGRRCLLILVSPLQINLVIPEDVPVGDLPVTVRSSAGVERGAGTARVRTVAPGLFSQNGSGRGPGAILNAVTFALGPFEAASRELQGEDRRTRLALYGTGLRFAGNPGRKTAVTNAAAAVRVEMRAMDGRIWRLPVEYAGEAPGFFGLDQVNVVLPPEAAGAGLVEFYLSAESASSNAVSAVIRSAEPPRIDLVTPTMVPPGSRIEVRGAGFALGTAGGRPRTTVQVTSPEGVSLQVSPLDLQDITLHFLLPPVYRLDGSLYEGALMVCVTVDEQSVCQENLLQVTALPASTAPPGEVMVSLTLDIARKAAALLREEGDAEAADALERAANQRVEALREMVREAQQGQTFSVRLPDGSVVETPLDLAALSRLESVLAIAFAEQQAALRSADLAHSKSIKSLAECLTEKERELEDAKRRHDAAEKELTNLSVLSLASLVALLIGSCYFTGCLATPIVVAKAMLVISAAFTTLGYEPLFDKLSIEQGPNLLTEIRAEPPTVTVLGGAEKQFVVQGRFTGLSAGVITVEVIERAIVDILTLGMANIASSPATKPLEKAVVSIASGVADLIFDKIGLDLLSRNVEGDLDQWVELGDASVVARAGDGTVARVQLRCDAEPTKAFGLNTGREEFDLQMINENFLLFPDRVRPPAGVEVLVNRAYNPELTIGKYSYRPDEIVRIMGVLFAPLSEVSTLVLDPRGGVIAFTGVTDRAGSFQESLPLDEGKPRGSYRVESTVAGMDGTVVSFFEVVEPGDGPPEPAVILVATDTSRYVPGDSLRVYVRTTAGEGISQEYALMLRFTSEATGSHYYLYDDPTDQNRWLHTGVQPAWVGVPEDREFVIPGPGEPPAEISQDTPSGRFVVTAYFSEIGQNFAVGAAARTAVLIQTPQPEGQCFIATAAFGPSAPAVRILRRLRDEQLVQSQWGRELVAFYYRISPPAARFIEANRPARFGASLLLLPIASLALLSVTVHPVAAALAALLYVWVIVMTARRLGRSLRRKTSRRSGETSSS